MKLAEALVLRADMQRRAEQLRDRLRKSALVQEGEQPPEDPQALLAEVAALLVQLTDLIVRINRANLQTTLADGMSVTEALARRDMLTTQQSIFESVVSAASDRIDRYSRTEIRRVATVDVAMLRRQIDDLARRRRELDTAIQATNWAMDLVE